MKNNRQFLGFFSVKGGTFHGGMAVFFLCAVIFFNLIHPASADEKTVRVEMQTNLGGITLELDSQKAPLTVANFLRYVESGFFDGTVFHRVIKGFMIQGGGFTTEMQKKQTAASVKNEADNGLRNLRGTIAMARTSDPHSASSQFFINTVDNGFLDHSGKTPSGWGYCVFGKVVQGMAVVDAIAAQPTTVRGMYRDVPVKPVIVSKVKLAEVKSATPEK